MALRAEENSLSAYNKIYEYNTNAFYTKCLKIINTSQQRN